MHPPRTLGASEAWFQLCCPNPFPDPHTPNSSATAESSSSSSRHNFAASIASTLDPDEQFTNHESLPSLEDSISSFTKIYPQYNQQDRADQIRGSEYYHLALARHVCLDYIGHGLFSYSQLKPVASSSTALQPPFFDISHKSTTLKSEVSYGGGLVSEVESGIRTRLLGFMNLSEAEYAVVFTANQSSAFKLLADSYPFRTNRNLLTVYDHQSDAADLMIESSRRRGARVGSGEFVWPGLRIESRKLRRLIIGKGKKDNKGLFVFPLQSRVTGARYAYKWLGLARENGWDVLLDTSALGPKEMETLGLSIFRPEFLFCSCFKVFGENPSGFGCLFIKRSSVSMFDDSTMMASSIGIVSLVPIIGPGSGQDSQSDCDSSPKSLFHRLREDGYKSQENEEDVRGRRLGKGEINGGLGTIECKGLDHADSIGLILISCRARYLINWLVNALTSLTHPDSGQGRSLVTIYGPKVKFERGPAVAFNLFDWKGERIDPPLVQKLADRNNISLSYGSLRHVLFSDEYQVRKTRTYELGEGTFVKRKKEKLPSEVVVVTAALGFLSNFEDVYRLWAFVSRFLDADFVEKERWRYTALNQKTVEV